MRLFVAITPPEEVRAHLDEFVEPRRLVADGPRWISARYWHITLAFMAEVAERDLDEVEERLREAVQRSRPLDLTLIGAGVFPDPSQAKVLWTGITEDPDPEPQDGWTVSAGTETAPELTRLATRCRTAIGRAGVRVDGATYRPHLTLARWRTPTEATRWLKALGSYRGPTWSADRVQLVHSQLGHAGPPHYDTIAEFVL